MSKGVGAAKATSDGVIWTRFYFGLSKYCMIITYRAGESICVLCKK